MKIRLFVVLAALFLLFTSREPPWGDAHVVYATTQNLVDHGRLDVNLGGPPQFYAIRNGKRYGVFPLGNVVAMAAGYLAFRAVTALPVPRFLVQPLYRYTCHLSPALLVAGACVLFFWLALREGASRRMALLLSLALGTCTVLAVYARAPFSEALQTLALTWVLERGYSLGERLTLRGAFFGGLACGLLVNTKLVYALVLPVVLVYVAVQHRRELRRLLAAIGVAALPLFALVGVALLHNHLKTGSYLDSGYRIPNGVFSGDAYAALYGFYLSTGKSIFLYSPPLVLGALAFPGYYRRAKPRALFLLALSGVIVLANAKFRYWHADYCWGPRLLVPLTPAWLLPAAPWLSGVLARGRAKLRAFGVGALLGAGLFVQILGCAFYWDHYIRIAIAVKDQTGAEGWFTEDLHQCHFIPEFSPIVGHAWLLHHVLRNDPDLYRDAPFRRVIAAPVDLSSFWGGLRPDTWMHDWYFIPGAIPWGLGLVALWVAVITAAALGLRRKLREGDRAEARAGPAYSLSPPRLAARR